MITDLANLGPSQPRTTDLGANRGKDKAAGNPNGRPDASSFDQILKTSSANESQKSDKVVREQQLQKDPVPVQKRMDDRTQPRSEGKVVDSSRNEPRTAQKENKNWEEPGSVQEKRNSEKDGSKAGSQSQVREQVMLEFMDSMESEFGIPPQRIVEAMTKIPTSEQLSSPEDSASQVIAQLDLPDDQEQKALALYMGMLAQLKMAQENPNAKMVAVAAGAGGAGMAAAVMTSQQRRDVLNKSLDQMNSKFFMQGPGALKPEPQALQSFNSNLQQAPGDLMDPNALPKDQVSFGQAQARPEKLPPFMQNKEAAMDPKLKDLQAQMQNVDPNSKEAQALMKSLAALGASAAALEKGMKLDPQNAQALKAEQMLNGKNAEAGAAGAAGLSGLAALGLGNNDEDSDEMGGDQSSPDQQFVFAQAPTHLDRATRGDAIGSQTQFGAMMAGGAMAQGMDASDKQANVQQLMTQAQYLIKKGGGEAKIQMAPEGIGQVHMKMTLLDGKVNLEMQTESKEAKKLIESSLGDLKTHLSHHQLQVDQVKVDVGNQTSSDTRQDSQQRQQMDARQDQSKQQARDFWSEFNGGGSGAFERRSGFNDASGIRAYGGSKRETPLAPAGSASAAVKSYTGSGKGRGLDLVA